MEGSQEGRRRASELEEQKTTTDDLPEGKKGIKNEKERGEETKNIFREKLSIILFFDRSS